MTKTSPSVLAVFFLLLYLCSTQRIGAVPVEPDNQVTEEERKGENEVGQRHMVRTIDQIILDAYGGLAAEKAAEDYRMMVGGVETEGMDTLLTPGQSAILHNSFWSKRSKRRLPSFVTVWTGGVVPYDISGLSAQYRSMMMEAFRDWERSTCVRFVPARPEHQQRIVFTSGSGCWSYLGMIGWSQQPINVGPGCNYKSTYLHELGHALGLVHEHQLPQRDWYIYVHLANVIPRYRDQFNRYPSSVIPDAEKVTYSYRSIMHYSKYAFTRRSGLQTIYARDRSQDDVMGASDELASSDIEVINLLYNCNAGNFPAWMFY